jgi:DNA-binding SARP family transcriptional activator
MQFLVLGPLEVHHGGQPLKLAGGRQRVLPALLLLQAHKFVSRDSLIDALWNGKPPRDAELRTEVRDERRRPAELDEDLPL